MICTNCQKTKAQARGQWWHLNHYFGISGSFCPACYDLVSHDAYGKPNHPKAHKKIKESQ